MSAKTAECSQPRRRNAPNATATVSRNRGEVFSTAARAVITREGSRRQALEKRDSPAEGAARLPRSPRHTAMPSPRPILHALVRLALRTCAPIREESLGALPPWHRLRRVWVINDRCLDGGIERRLDHLRTALVSRSTRWSPSTEGNAGTCGRCRPIRRHQWRQDEVRQRVASVNGRPLVWGISMPPGDCGPLAKGGECTCRPHGAKKLKSVHASIPQRVSYARAPPMRPTQVARAG